MHISFTIDGTPVAKARPRVSKWGTYTPQKTVNYEVLIQEMYMIHCKKVKLTGPLRANITAYFPIPQSKSEIDKQLMREGYIRHTSKPDWDNIGKIVSDALNKIAYDDDSSIVTASVEKYYSDNPRLEVDIAELFENYDEMIKDLKTIRKKTKKSR